MTVKEVIFAAAAELGIYKEIQEYLDYGGTEGEKNAELLLTCFNIVENELALDYFPLYAEGEVHSLTGRVEFSSFDRSVIRILRVTDEEGNKLKYTLFPSYLKTEPGTLKIAYTYTPETKAFSDDGDFYLQVSVRLMAYGVAAEYATATGLYEEAAIWDKKYKDAIEAAYRARPAERMRSRRWA